MAMNERGGDSWSTWLLKRRFADDPDRIEQGSIRLAEFRDLVLGHAQLGEGDVLLDAGCGDGLIPFGALDREPTCRVVFTDISTDLLELCREQAESAGWLDRCQFIRCSADDLSGVDTGSVDVVTARAVLCYVGDKAAAFRAIWRVLKPGGRLSILEPVNSYFQRFGRQAPPTFDYGPVGELADRVRRVSRQRNPAVTTAMLDFDENDLLRWAEETGFSDIHLQLDVEIVRTAGRSWDGWYQSAPNPCAPTREEAVREALTPDEAARYVAYVRPLIEQGRGTSREARACLWARKESAGV